MANTFFGLTIGSSGLFASNAAINTTAHNISNINTKGYTKQVSNQQAAESIRVKSSTCLVLFGDIQNGIRKLLR